MNLNTLIISDYSHYLTARIKKWATLDHSMNTDKIWELTKTALDFFYPYKGSCIFHKDMRKILCVHIFAYTYSKV